MILGLGHGYPADAVERTLPDVDSARALLASRRPDIIDLLRRRRSIYQEVYGDSALIYLDRAEGALQLALARFGMRHGTLGDDFHHYHNEDHALEILDRRLGRVLNQVGVEALPGPDWFALSLFAACHDLRQREPSNGHGQGQGQVIGNNEAASIAETHRILTAAGFNPQADRALYIALEVMIAGSTFDVPPRPAGVEPGTPMPDGGPLAPRLVRELEREGVPNREAPEVRWALKLALIASDLDTANVGERFIDFAASASRLASEREMRMHRSLHDPSSGPPVLSFLTGGQERYFFELHRFCSDIGLRVFGPGKDANAARVRAQSERLNQRFPTSATGYSGAEVIAAHTRFAELK